MKIADFNLVGKSLVHRRRDRIRRPQQERVSALRDSHGNYILEFDSLFGLLSFNYLLRNKMADIKVRVEDVAKLRSNNTCVHSEERRQNYN